MKRVLFLIAFIGIAIASWADDSGICGENLTWSFVESTGTLTISGNGDMYDYYPANGICAPWCYTDIHEKIQKVSITTGVTSIGSYSFYNCTALESIEIPSSVISIGYCAFSDCTALKSIEIPKSVTLINGGVFSRCISLKSISIPNGVTSIGVGAFSSCVALTAIEIPSSVTSIGNYAFDGCYGLTSIEIPNSVTSLGNNVFRGCYFSKIIVDDKNKVFDSRDNCNAIIRTATNSLVVGCKNTKIPNSVTSIEESAFSCNFSLTSISIPSNIKKVDKNAFEGCDNLSTLIINTKGSFDESVFSDCHLKSVFVISDSTVIAEKTFGTKTYNHATLYVPEGMWANFAYSSRYWYQFIHIREYALSAESLSRAKVYSVMSMNSSDYLVYDAINESVTTKSSILDDSPSHNWQIVGNGYNCYLYNLGARKYAKVSPNGEFELSDIPVAVAMKTTDQGIVIGNGNSTYAFIVNDYLNIDYMVSGIEPNHEESIASYNYYSINGHTISNPQKGLNIIRSKDGTTKKILIK